MSKKSTDRRDKNYLSYFLLEQKDGSIRIILNVKKLNVHINRKLFKMVNFEQAIQLINNGSYIASVAIRYVYYSVKIAYEQLYFKWQR